MIHYKPGLQFKEFTIEFHGGSSYFCPVFIDNDHASVLELLLEDKPYQPETPTLWKEHYLNNCGEEDQPALEAYLRRGLTRGSWTHELNRIAMKKLEYLSSKAGTYEENVKFPPDHRHSIEFRYGGWDRVDEYGMFPTNPNYRASLDWAICQATSEVFNAYQKAYPGSLLVMRAYTHPYTARTVNYFEPKTPTIPSMPPLQMVLNEDAKV